VISSAEFDSFVAKAEHEHRGNMVLAANDLTITVVERPRPEGQRGRPRRHIMVSNDQSPVEATPRFKSNLIRLTGLTSKLMTELPLPQLNSDIRHQLNLHAPAVGFIKAGIEGVESGVALYNAARPYIPYNEMMPSGDLATCHGSPLMDDQICLQTLDQEVDLGGRPLLVGLHAKVSSTGMAKTGVHFGFFRTGCENSAVDIGFGGNYLKDVDPILFNGVVTELRARVPEYVEDITRFIGQAQEFSVADPEFLDPAMAHLSVPKKMKELLLLSVQHPDDLGDLFDRSGVERVTTLWDAYNVLTHMGSLAVTSAQQMAYAAATTTWAKSLLNISRN